MNDRDSSELERRLRGALRSVEPPTGFAERILETLARARSRTSAARGPSPRARRSWSGMRWSWPSAAAAAGLAAVLIGTGLWGSEHARELRAHEARAQVLEALRISSQTLNGALHRTVDPSRPG